MLDPVAVLVVAAGGIASARGCAGRSVRNRVTNAWHGQGAELAADAGARRHLAEARRTGDFDTASIYAGQGVGLVRRSVSATQVERDLGEGAASLLTKRLGGEPRSR